MWGIPALLFLIAFFHRVAPGVIAKDLMQAFDATGAIVGLLSSTYFYAYAGLMIPAGLLIDAFGVRRVVAIGGAVMGLGTLAMAVASSQGPLFAGRFAVGLGATVTFIGTLQIAASWFPASHFGTLSAITATMGILGSLIATYPLAGLVALTGWRGIKMWSGPWRRPICFGCPRPPRGREGARLAAFHDVVGACWRCSGIHTWPPFLTFFCLYAAMGNIMLWAVPFLRDVYGLSTTRAALYATATSLALLVSAPLTGFLSDQVVKRRKLPYTVLTGCSFALWLVFVGTLGALPLGGVYALFLAMGVAGGSFVLTWPLGREVNPPHLAGIAVAVANLGGFLGAALTQGPLGALLDSGWAGVVASGARVYPLEAYRRVFVACALFALAASLITLLLRETRGRNIYHELTRSARSPSGRGPMRRRATDVAHECYHHRGTTMERRAGNLQRQPGVPTLVLRWSRPSPGGQ
jgi:MFS family permease